MSAEQRLPSPSGARLSGDDFQHIVTWLEVLKLLGEDGVTRVGFEVGQAEAGVVDDLLVGRDEAHPDRYAQIKFAVDDTTPLSAEWFTTPPREGAAAPLHRFHQSFHQLSAPGRPAQLELITNRQTDPADPVLKHRNGLDGTLLPRLFAAHEAASVAARAAWAQHLGIEEGELAEFLSALVISPSRGTIDDLLERCRGAMALVGLRGDAEAITIGVAALRRLIEEGRRELDRDGLRELIEAAGLEAAPAHSTLVIEEIAPLPLAALAPAHVDWVELFEGDAPENRRQTADPDAWEEVMRPDLRRAISELRERGELARLRIEAAYRLPGAFITGFELNERTDVELILPFAGVEWSTAAEPEDAPLAAESTEIGQGSELALALAISAPLANDVEAFIRAESLPVDSLLTITPAEGHGRHSVAGPGAARTMAEQVVDIAREQVAGRSAVHLFLAAPSPIAVMLGRVWNRLPPTRIYADLNPGYAPTYLVET